MKPQALLSVIALASGLCGAAASVSAASDDAAAKPAAAKPQRSPGTAAPQSMRTRVMLLWNRSIDDGIAPQTQHVETLRVDRQADSSRLQLTSGQGVVEVKPRSPFAQRDEAILLAAFKQTLVDGNVTPVDRAAGIRTTHAGDRNETNSRLVESDAMLGLTDLVMEVSLIADSQSPIGIAFNIEVKDFVTGQNLATRFTQALPPPGPRKGRWVGTDAGFKWIEETQAIPEFPEIGRILGETSLLAISQASELKLSQGRAR